MEQRLGSESSLIRVLIAAGSVIMQAGLEALLASSPVLEIVGRASGSQPLVQQVEHLQPDVLLWEGSNWELELLSPLWTGEPDLETLDRPLPYPAIVLLVEDWQQPTIAAALRAGIRSILPREATASDMVAAIQAAAIGLTVLHPDVLEGLLSVLPIPARPLPSESNQTLTGREVEVLRMLAEGLGNKTIARRLGISEHTVKFHIGSLFSKLNASSRTEAVILGARQGLILL